jgi:hypothetical protein
MSATASDSSGSSAYGITKSYEEWMRERLPYVEEKHLKSKYKQMAKAGTNAVFKFLRGTFYLWSLRFHQELPELMALTLPRVIGVGDVHVENFGTWRDAEGRLVWGANDVDEATSMPCTQDLVRLMTSAALAGLDIETVDIAEQILDGYRSQLITGARPFVLAFADEQPWQTQLWKLARARTADPVEWWRKLDSKLEMPAQQPDPDVLEQLSARFPVGPVTGLSWQTREAGMGSLGRPRLIASGTWFGGRICREAKATLPSAWDWAMGTVEAGAPTGQLLTSPYRAPDPYSAVADGWSIRRLAPDSDKIDIDTLEVADDKRELLRCMGSELANIHLVSASADTLGSALDGVGASMLDATTTMTRVVEEDQRNYAKAA